MSELLRRATQPALHRGLDGVVVDESEISRVFGDAGQLIYRGYDIDDLARRASFEEVLYLLWQGSLPSRDELEAFSEEMADERAIDEAIVDTLDSLADAGETPMAALRTGVSMLSAYDPEADADPRDLEAAFRQGRRIAAAMPTIVAAYDRLRRDEAPVEPRSDLSHAANFLYMLSGEAPDDVFTDTFDMALTLHADHGLNASTFTTLVV
ncbi:MAG: citrate/2-methylcitrate synthase, partial [Halobacteriales archaeon]